MDSAITARDTEPPVLVRPSRDGYIDADNVASLGIHERFGFVRVGLLPGVAYRYGRWCDTVMVQRSLGPGASDAPAGLGR